MPKTLEEIHSADAQVEESDEGRLDILFWINQATEIDEQLRTCAYLEKEYQSKLGSTIKGLKRQTSLENDQFPKTTAKACVTLNDHNHQKIEKEFKPKIKGGDKNKNKKNADVIKLSLTQWKKIRRWARGKPRHEKPNCQEIPHEGWRIKKSKPEKKKTSTQRSETSAETSTAIVPHFRVHALGWSGVYFRPKENVPTCKNDASKRGFEESKVNF